MRYSKKKTKVIIIVSIVLSMIFLSFCCAQFLEFYLKRAIELEKIDKLNFDKNLEMLIFHPFKTFCLENEDKSYKVNEECVYSMIWSGKFPFEEFIPESYIIICKQPRIFDILMTSKKIEYIDSFSYKFSYNFAERYMKVSILRYLAAIIKFFKKPGKYLFLTNLCYKIYYDFYNYNIKRETNKLEYSGIYFRTNKEVLEYFLFLVGDDNNFKDVKSETVKYKNDNISIILLMKTFNYLL